MKILKSKLESHIETLAKYNSTPERGVTRVVYTEEDKRAKQYIRAEMEKLALEVKEDEVGNIFGTWKGNDRNLPQVWIGSHMDAPTNGGKYDGVVGVIGALEATSLLKESGFQPECDLVIVIFASEEPTRFGVGCIGSRALTGMIKESNLDEWTDDQNESFRKVLINNGRNPEKVLREQLDPAKIKTFIELHIEQGAVLENENLDIGIVNIIAAPSEIHLKIYGEQRHAGSTPMNLRKDPLPAASEVILLIEKLTKEVSKTSVGTVGKMIINPGTSNVIAEKVEISIDIRDIDKKKKEEIIRKLKDGVSTIVERRDLTYKWEMRGDDVPSEMDQDNLIIIENSVKELGLTYKIMPSGAYHDAMIMSRKVPSNLIFIPSEKGISHSPEEYTSITEIAQGVELLSRVLKELAK